MPCAVVHSLLRPWRCCCCCCTGGGGRRHGLVRGLPGALFGSGIRVASADDAPVCIVLHSDPWQVLSAADLAALVRSSAQQQGDVVSIVGFGSLLSERSTRLTFPRASDFRVARLPGFRRVFGHVAPVFLRRGLHRVDDAGILRAASLSIERWGGGGEEPLSVTLFEIPGEEMGAFLERVRGAGRIHLSLYVCMYVCVCRYEACACSARRGAGGRV